MQPLLELENLEMTFKAGGGLFKKNRRGGVVAGVNLQLNQSEIVAVVGESGCGKTTVGKMVAGLIKPTAGRILYKGQDINSLRGEAFSVYRKGVQMVHQDSYAARNPRGASSSRLAIRSCIIVW